MSFFDYYVDEMSTYGTNESFDLTAEEDAFMESIGEADCSGDPDEILEEAALEVVENFHALTEALMVDEFTTYVATNEEVVYEEGRLKSIFNSIKGVIQKAWAKVKAAFTKFKDMIMGKLGNDKKFIDRYKSKIEKKQIKVKMPAKGGKALSFDDIKRVNYMDNLIKRFANETNNYLTAGISQYKDASKVDSGMSSAKDMDADAVLKSILGGKSTDDYYKVIKDDILPDTSEVTVKGPDVIAEISSAKGTNAVIKATYAYAKNFFGSMLKEASRQEKLAINLTSRKDAKEGGVTAGVSKYQTLVKKCLVVAFRINNYQLRATSRLRSAYRAAATRMASGGEDIKEESTDMLARFEASMSL